MTIFLEELRFAVAGVILDTDGHLKTNETCPHGHTLNLACSCRMFRKQAPTNPNDCKGRVFALHSVDEVIPPIGAEQ